MKPIRLLSLVVVLACPDAVLAQFGRSGDVRQKLQREVDRAQREAEQSIEKATEERKAEESRRKSFEAAMLQQEKVRADEARRAAEQETKRLQAINDAEVLKREAQMLAQQNAALEAELRNRQDELDEAILRLDAEARQLQLEKESHNSAAAALENEKALLENEKTAIEGKAFLYSMGFWASIGAIAIGCVSALMRLPTVTLEREKLRKEIELLARKIADPARR
jgi:DNA repair exonuclease SbcCD ATPase subunit